MTLRRRKGTMFVWICPRKSTYSTYPHPPSIKPESEKDCQCSQAVYAKDKDGTITVENSCRLGSTSGHRQVDRGLIAVSDPGMNAKLQLRFPNRRPADYWSFFLDPEYRGTGVSNADGSALWVFSRRR